MKKLHFILTAVLALTIVGGIHAQNKNNETEVTFSVNMHCEQCKKKIMNSLPFEKGVMDMKVDVAKKEAWIKFDSKQTDKEKLQKAFEKLGYTVTEVDVKAKAQLKVDGGCKTPCKSAHTDGCVKADKKIESKEVIEKSE